MPCYHPIPAWRHRGETGKYNLTHHKNRDVDTISFNCDKCLGCKAAHRKDWALRGQLELQQHDRASFTTLTYTDEHVPVTLDKRALQLYLKRLRRALDRQKPARPLRFIASGEYGSQSKRPHYHLIQYGVDARDEALMQHAWPFGFVRNDPVTPETIAYVTGYTTKKIEGRRHAQAFDVIDYSTGEVLFEYQPEFLQMSRRPGIAAHAKQFLKSWRSVAVSNGKLQRVPRYLHKAWQDQAEPHDIDQLQVDRWHHARENPHARTREHLQAMEANHETRQEQALSRGKL